MQRRIQRASNEDFELADEYRELQRTGRVRDPKDAARVIAYLVLPTTHRNGQVLQFDDADLAAAVEDALPG